MNEGEKWDKLAECYDEKVFHLTKYPQVIENILSKVKSGLVLDMGCGPTGLLLNALKDAGNTVYGMDISPMMIAQAGRTFRGILSCDDMRNTMFRSGIFDSVVSVNSILPEHRSEVLDAIHEAYRILKPGGKFIAYLPSFDYVMKIREQGYFVDIDMHEKRVYDTEQWQCFYTPDLIREMLTECGFKKWTLDRYTFDWPEAIEDVQKLYGFDVSEFPIEEYVVVAEK